MKMTNRLSFVLIFIMGLAGAQRAHAGVAATVTGGTVVTTNGYRFCTFTTGGTFSVTAGGVVDVLVVAGGGGGGCTGGGGGAGGLVYSNAFPVSVSNYVVTVGSGGTGSTSRTAQGSNGNNSVFGAITAIGGGGGGSYGAAPYTAGYRSGNSGGSGGGAAGANNNGGTLGTNGYGTSGQGNNGGTAPTNSFGGGGGGGAGTTGTNGNSTVAGAGGAGLSCSILGTATNYAGGGGGGGDTAGAGGSGGGGAGSTLNANATAGSANTGGGGGGSRKNNDGAGYGGSGGSGIVIVRYAFIAATVLPVISDGVPQNLSNTSVDVVGTLGTNGSAGTATVSLYWSTTDGMTNASAWTSGSGSVSNLGSGFADGTTFTNTLTGLAANTTYYWNYRAVNASGTVWGATAGSPSFKTFGTPGVINGAATSVTEFSAMLNGNLTNGTSAHVYILLGLTDGVWSVTNDLSTLSQGAFSTNVTGLTLATKYYCTAYATNAYGTALAAPSTSFTTWAGQNYVFTNNNQNWTVPGNWTGGSFAPPHNGDIGYITNKTALANGNLYNVGVDTPPAQIWVQTTNASLQIMNGVTLAEHNIVLDGGTLAESASGGTATNNGTIRVNSNSTLGLGSIVSALTLNGPIQDNGGNTGTLATKDAGANNFTGYILASSNTWTGGLKVGWRSVVYAGASGCLGTGPIMVTNGLLVTAWQRPSGPYEAMATNMNVVAVTNVFGSATVTVCGASAKHSQYNVGELEVLGDSPNATYILNSGGILGMHTNLVGGTLILNGGTVGVTDYSAGIFSGAFNDYWSVNPTFYGPVKVRGNSYLGNGGNDAFALSGPIQDDGVNTGTLMTQPPSYAQASIKLFTTNSTWTGGLLAQGQVVYAAASNCLGRGAITINNAETYPGRWSFQPSGYPPSEFFQLSVPWAGMNVSSFTVQTNGYLIICDSNVVGSVPITLGAGAMLQYKGTPAGLTTMSFSGNNIVSGNGIIAVNVNSPALTTRDTILVNTSVTFMSSGGGVGFLNVSGYVADGVTVGKVIATSGSANIAGNSADWVKLGCSTNGYSGGTDVNRGLMEILAAGALSTGNVNVNSGGRLKTSASNCFASVTNAGHSITVNANGALELNSTETAPYAVQTGGALMMDSGGKTSQFNYGSSGNIQLAQGAILDTTVATRPTHAQVTGQLAAGDGRFGLYEGRNGASGSGTLATYTATRFFGDDNNTNIWRGLGLLNGGGSMICGNTMVTNAGTVHLDYYAQRDSTFTFSNASLLASAVLLDGQGTFIFQNGSGTSTYSSITFNGGAPGVGGLKIVSNGDVRAGATINVSNGWFAASYTDTLAGLTVNLGSGAVFNITTNPMAGAINVNPGAAVCGNLFTNISSGANWAVYAGTQIGLGVGRSGGRVTIYNLPTNGVADFVGWCDYVNGGNPALPLNLNGGLTLGNNTRFTPGPYNDGYTVVNSLTVTNSDGGAGGEAIQLAAGSTQCRLCSPGGTVNTMNLPVTLNAGAGKLIVGDTNLFNALLVGGVSGYMPITQNGTVYLTSSANQIGDVDIQAGTLEVNALAGLGTSAAAGGSRTIAISNNATMWFNYANPVLSNATLRGGGTLAMSTATDTLTLTNSAGVSGAIQPGMAGPLAVQGNLAFAASATPTPFAVNIGKTGGLVTNAMLAVSGSVTGLTNASLYVTFDAKMNAADGVGKVFTILTCANDLSATRFNIVTWASPAKGGTVVYANGAVQLTNLSIPAAGSVILFQ